jgi:hypothetical protein
MHKPYDIFISYATEDEEFVESLERSLRFLGFKTWFAPLILQVGDKLLDSINAGLIASEFGLVVISPSYISKAWTSYEMDVLHRQHIEKEKRLFPLWHGIGKEEIDQWNPGLSGIFALKSSEGVSSIADKIAKVISKDAPIRGVTPSYENPQWRFLQGRGELLANNIDGGAFNLFEAAEFPDNHFPLYIYERLYTRRDIVIEVTKALFYGSYDDLRLSADRKGRLIALCKSFGFDLEAPYFDAATIG